MLQVEREMLVRQGSLPAKLLEDFLFSGLGRPSCCIMKVQAKDVFFIGKRYPIVLQAHN